MSIFSYKKLFLAYLDCRKTKRNSASAIEFEFDLENNLRKLLDELKFRKYNPGRSICFVVRNPKPREVFAAEFRDRVVHHLLVRELHDPGERAFIFDSYACRKGKGTHKAVKKLRKFLGGKHEGKQPLHFLQLDVMGFFMSISKEILVELVAKLIAKQNNPEKWKEETRWLAEKIILHDPTKNFQMNSPMEFFDLIPDHKSLFKQPDGNGLPIGNYSSQFFANLYLNELDQFIKRILKCKMYLRYVDDFVLLHHNPLVLKDWMKQIKFFAEKKMNLEISDRKIRMQEARKGVDFLGYFIKPDYLLARKSVVANFKRKISGKFLKNTEEKHIDFKAMVSSYFGHFMHANCETLMKKYAIYLK